MNRANIDAVLRSLRRVNLQGSFFGQTVAIRFGLSESDIQTLEALMEMGASTAGRLADLTGLTSGAVTRVVDRLEQGGYVRRVPDPADRRRVIVEVVPEKVTAVEAALNRIGSASAEEIGRYTDAQLALITDFLSRMEQITRDQATTLRETSEPMPGAEGPSEHSAPLAALAAARLHVRSGVSRLQIGPGTNPLELYRARFDGATPQVRLREGRVLVQYRGIPFDWRKRVAAFGLNPTIPWTIEVVGGVGRLEADLRAIPLARFDLTGGSDRVQLELGRPAGEVPIRVVGGMTTLRIERPAGSALRLKVSGGSGKVELDGMQLSHRGGETTAETPGWSETTDRFSVEAVGGSKAIEIVPRPD
ncbi:MAG TPA: MarR family winged helix-turn-helix transcriptional regulator [Candidatus Limnocylindrales bacterium]|nr:MarR family winged helix-turn-helix transcriptional regulator [Candidatus Limnocylindrales bacterium]